MIADAIIQFVGMKKAVPCRKMTVPIVFSSFFSIFI